MFNLGRSCLGRRVAIGFTGQHSFGSSGRGDRAVNPIENGGFRNTMYCFHQDGCIILSLIWYFRFLFGWYRSWPRLWLIQLDRFGTMRNKKIGKRVKERPQWIGMELANQSLLDSEIFPSCLLWCPEDVFIAYCQYYFDWDVPLYVSSSIDGGWKCLRSRKSRRSDSSVRSKLTWNKERIFLSQELAEPILTVSRNSLGGFIAVGTASCLSAICIATINLRHPRWGIPNSSKLTRFLRGLRVGENRGAWRTLDGRGVWSMMRRLGIGWQ